MPSRNRDQRIRALRTQQRIMAGPLFPALSKSVDALGGAILGDDDMPALFIALGRTLDDIIEPENELAEAVTDLVIELAVAGVARAYLDLERRIRALIDDASEPEPDDGASALKRSAILMRTKAPIPSAPFPVVEPGES